MTSRFYDAVVLGRSLGSLAAAALLARRDFRVLLLGQAERPQSYRFEGRVLCRRTFTLLFGTSPIWRRILHELAQSPQFRRRTQALDPMFVALLPNRRVEFAPDVELFAREIDREFPEIRQIVDELYDSIGQINALTDAAFDRDAVWPPGTLWERFETSRAASLLPATTGLRSDILAKFPSGHTFRDLVLLPAAFASNLASTALELPGLSVARLHGSWTRGVQMLARAEEELSDFLVERIVAHGGVIELERRATSLHVKNGGAAGVVLDGDDEPTGTSAVLSNQWGEVLADLAGGEGITKAARKDWPRLTPEASRFVVSLVVRREALQAPLGSEAFAVPARRDPRHPALHVQRLEPGALSGGAAPGGEALLVAECLLPARGSLSLLEAREAVLSTLREALPFLDQHLLLVDSPHDGLPLYDYTSGVKREIDRIHVNGTAPNGEPMERLWTVDPPGYRELSGEPVRGPIPNTYLVGKTVLPALGQEGELMAAVSAARIVTQRDRTRQKLRRQMWSKIETT